MTGVSFVVPVLNGRRYLRRTLFAIIREAHSRPFEIIVVDDGSRDRSLAIAEALGRSTGASIQALRGPARGAAAALNAGIRVARYPYIAQVDQDVIVDPGWLNALLECLEKDEQVAAAQGRYVVPSAAGFWARMAGRDLDLRYLDLLRRTVDHVCTGNTVYRASALHRIDLFDERLGYGYDNDASYRLLNTGATLAFCPDATAEHHWREGLGGYLRQQFGVGYGRLDLVRSHPRRWRGDAVSSVVMMAHAPLMLVAILLASVSLFRHAAAWYSVAILAALVSERTIAGIRAWRLTRDRTALLFPAAHLVRDTAWAAAIVVWTVRQLSGGSRPDDSMPRRRAAGDTVDEGSGRALVLIPAYNEAANLRAVVDDLRRRLPDADVLVINDASSDDTAAVLPTLGVKWLTLAERVGVGGALRAGVRYARRRGYTIVGRLDGDGQHRASDLRRLIRVVRDGADAVTGSRYLERDRRVRRATWQQLLSIALSVVTRTRVTDPTSGIWAFGRRALPLLDQHHPGGYPEPELRLLLERHGMDVEEVAVHVQNRQAGRTSLTPARSAIAFARTALALLFSAVGGSVGSRD